MPNPPLDPRLLTFARDMRRDATDAEELLWQLLRNRRLAGFKFRRQVPISGYIVDFYCHESCLGVELDGQPHDDPERQDYDDRRSAALASSDGLRIVRFWNEVVLKHPEVLLEEILCYLNDSTLQAPSP
jgi:adenine-specific DNA-methyltransferase